MRARSVLNLERIGTGKLFVVATLSATAATTAAPGRSDPCPA